MTASREQRLLATELKFMVSPMLGDAVRDWARAHLQADPNGGGVYQDMYTTTTLYTDTPEGHVYARQGSYRRCKFRVRRYGESKLIFLERKLRTNVLLSKRRQQVPLDELFRLDQPLTELSDWSGDWFAARLALRRLAPVCQVAYDRVARVTQTPHGLARLTIDSQLRARTSTAWAFSDGTLLPVMEGGQIVEMKFLVAMPAVFKHVLTEFNLAAVSISKYRLAVEGLGLTTRTAALESV